MSEALLAGIALASPLAAATTELTVVDRYTGLAISGFDPVAYFTLETPTVGLGQYEYGFAGATWRFRNAGNRLAFMANPEIYGPRFGGYDPTGVARGVAVAGNPLLWAIANDRLYLFFSREAREAFIVDPISVSATADRNWMAVQLTLSP